VTEAEGEVAGQTEVVDKVEAASVEQLGLEAGAKVVETKAEVAKVELQVDEVVVENGVQAIQAVMTEAALMEGAD